MGETGPGLDEGPRLVGNLGELFLVLPSFDLLLNCLRILHVPQSAKYTLFVAITGMEGCFPHFCLTAWWISHKIAEKSQKCGQRGKWELGARRSNLAMQMHLRK